MSTLTAYEYDVLVASSKDDSTASTVKVVPKALFKWLQAEALRLSESSETAWLRLSQCHGQPAVRLLNYVGVVRSPDGFQLEILPKVGKVSEPAHKTRQLLIEMLRCLNGFRFIQTEQALLATANMPLLEVFISEFLSSVERLVKRGIHSEYVLEESNLYTLRGKLQFSQHIRANIVRKDRFYVAHDAYLQDRPVNRLLHRAILHVLSWSKDAHNQKRARELSFIFADIPASIAVHTDLQRMRVGRGMIHYHEPVEWMKLILGNLSPLTGRGMHDVFSLLFPMEAVFEAFVAKHLRRQLKENQRLKTQAANHSLVQHLESNWFRLRPDLLIVENYSTKFVLDTKWKLIDASLDNGTQKYGLSQADFYQLFAYGASYLECTGDVILVFPKTESFHTALPKFTFNGLPNLRLWVLPFCLEQKILLEQENILFLSRNES